MSKEFQDDRLPHAVVCMRGNMRTGITYDAELAFGSTHWVLGTGYSTRELAKEAADKSVENLNVQIKALVSGFVNGLPQAKE